MSKTNLSAIPIWGKPFIGEGALGSMQTLPLSLLTYHHPFQSAIMGEVSKVEKQINLYVITNHPMSKSHRENKKQKKHAHWNKGGVVRIVLCDMSASPSHPPSTHVGD